MVIFLSFIVLTLLCLAIPAAMVTAQSITQTMVLDRQSDTERFAHLAQPTSATHPMTDIAAELDRYQTLYGVRAVLVTRENRIAADTRPGTGIGVAEKDDIETALSGERASSPSLIWPWDTSALVVAVPIVVEGEVVGAAVTLSPTDRARMSTLTWWLILVLGGLVILGLARLVVEPMARWILRPVRQLDQAANAIAAGELTRRTDASTGPEELRNLATSFNTMAKMIEELIDKQRAFISYTSHQLRTPLAVLRLQLESLCEEYSSGATRLTETLEEVDRLTGICDGLLALGRAESDTVTTCVEDVGAIATERILAWESLAARHCVRLRRTGGASASAVSSGGMLIHVLDALIDNAIKFCGPGTTVTVQVEVLDSEDPEDPGCVDIRVLDDGEGMSPEAAARATDPFWRGPGSESKPGSGLGLAICATLVTRMGGRFELRVAEPSGVDARVRLPLPSATSS
ncbi:HAMP domain-containing sensor histidine kinase [Sphaerisporangium perillae]|uniref:HAMP domain-containing sensor histidine kinase n=1 Tax=Sphaerisporangium perillae TaxID=2935860 RepID=UPI00200ED567|nr:HAMP domain-containing sensor histidine kinase [Sphaerisporangium perillae]